MRAAVKMIAIGRISFLIANPLVLILSKSKKIPATPNIAAEVVN
jgi:hypothetical protein